MSTFSASVQGRSCRREPAPAARAKTATVDKGVVYISRPLDRPDVRNAWSAAALFVRAESIDDLAAIAGTVPALTPTPTRSPPANRRSTAGYSPVKMSTAPRSSPARHSTAAR